MTKLKPLNLDFESLYDFFPYKEVEKLMLKIDREGHNFPHYTTCKTCEADFEEVVRFTIKYVKQRIRSACEFYLRYKDSPELLRIEQEIEPPEQFREYYAESKIKNVSVVSWDLKQYNEWLFKLAFNLKEEKENV
ncbi:hypothetical protein DRJ22_06090 [Candidatus Woesearchaeota archaeon]|nr:MAG: hypothetical protein DRJ22_06090 [Candidatus Woesearchaeota archaeon]